MGSEPLIAPQNYPWQTSIKPGQRRRWPQNGLIWLDAASGCRMCCHAGQSWLSGGLRPLPLSAGGAAKVFQHIQSQNAQLKVNSWSVQGSIKLLQWKYFVHISQPPRCLNMWLFLVLNCKLPSFDPSVKSKNQFFAFLASKTVYP